MANTAQARKRARQAESRRQNNMSLRSTLRSKVRKVVDAIGSGDREAASNAFKEATPVIDRMANRGIIHGNKAARQKSRLNKKIQAM